jgi:hypothetical protein
MESKLKVHLASAILAKTAAAVSSAAMDTVPLADALLPGKVVPAPTQEIALPVLARTVARAPPMTAMTSELVNTRFCVLAPVATWAIPALLPVPATPSLA